MFTVLGVIGDFWRYYIPAIKTHSLVCYFSVLKRDSYIQCLTLAQDIYIIGLNYAIMRITHQERVTRRS